MGDFVRFIEFSYKFFTPHNPSNPALIPFTSFFAFSLHSTCISTAYDEPTLFLPSFCLHKHASDTYRATKHHTPPLNVLLMAEQEQARKEGLCFPLACS